MKTNEEKFAIKLGEVISVDDEYFCGRIKAVCGDDKNREEIPYAYPLLPYMVHVMPKIGEGVILLISKAQRLFIGPIIHQPQFVNKDAFNEATSLLRGFNDKLMPSPDNDPNTHGAYPKKEEIALLSRKDSDIILGDKDVRIRCGVHLTDKNNDKYSIFNKKTPSFLKLKYHDENVLPNKTNTSATIVSENINLISTASNSGDFNVNDTNELINDEEMKKIIENAHQLPYGDVLVNFLKLFLNAFNKHTHNYNNLPPVSDDTYITLNNFKLNDILSKHVKIN